MAKLTSGPGWALSSEDEPKPSEAINPLSPKPKIRLEKRCGKQVTVISGLHTYGEQRLNAIAKDIKTMCGAGGTVKNGAIEIQGDHVILTQEWLKNNI